MEDKHIEKAPLCRNGSKKSLLEEIFKYIPEYKNYCEPFLGSGAVFWNVPNGKRTLINDLDKRITDYLRLLKKAPSDTSLYPQDLTTIDKISDYYKTHKNSKNIVDRVVCYKILFCNGFGSVPLRDSDIIYKNSNPFTVFENIEFYKDKLKGVTISSKDYEKVIEEIDSPDTFFFIDPPYQGSSDNIGYAQGNEFDFERFRQVVGNIKGKFMVTLNDNKYIRDLFKGYVIKTVTVFNKFNVVMKKEKKQRKELIIMNYSLSN